MKALLLYFHQKILPLTVRSLVLFATLWFLIGFSTGVSTLLGPVRWVTSQMRNAEMGSEGIVVKGIMITYVLLSALAALWFTRILQRTKFWHVRIGLIIIWLICGGAALWLMLNPAYLQTDRAADEVVNAMFTFGPYPDADKLQELKDAGYTAVVPLLHPAVVPFEPKLLADERASAASIGIEVIHIPMLPWLGKNEEALEQLRALARGGTGRYYVHCYLGKDRVRIVRRVINAEMPEITVAEEDGLGRSILTEQDFERGEIITLAPGVILTPFPTDDEFLGRIIASEVKQVVSLLDPADPEDRPWIEREKATLAPYGIPLLALPLPKIGIPELLLSDYALQVSQLPRPVIVHAFLTSSERSRAFQKAYQALAPEVPSLPSSISPAESIHVSETPTITDAQGWRQNALTFFSRAIPDIRSLILLTPFLFIYAMLAAAFSGWLKTVRQVRTPYTRKVFHFLIFTTASALQFGIGLHAVIIFSCIVVAIVLYTLYRGAGFPFYEALGRPTDEPHRSLFIFIPLVMTALGGLTGNLLFGKFAAIGYLVGGWGDAVGEPVGARWGRHKYKVRSLVGVPATRSWEGSSAVMLVGIAAATLGLITLGIAPGTALLIGCACGLGGAIVEGLSNHGLDNLTIQVASSAIAWFFLH